MMEVHDAWIEYEVHGEGDIGMLLIPGGVVADAFQPLASELARDPAGRFRVVDLHRRGYGRSSPAPSPFRIEDQAGDGLALMDALGLTKAHLVGHSLSGLIALQMAQLAPAKIGSLTLIEPSLIGFVPSAPQAAQSLSKVGALYQSGDRAGAVDTFLRGVSGEDYRERVGRALPAGWFDQAVKDLDTFMRVELPAIRSWRFDARDLVKQPILSIYGTERRWGGTAASGAEFDQVVHAWFPQTRSFPVRGAYHWPHVTNTHDVAEELAAFVAAAAAQAVPIPADRGPTPH
jgi:pimeloyl-ACP methyl ester carboxylesterase